MTTSPDYRIPNPPPLNLDTRIVSSEKPSKWRCNLIKSTEMGVSSSADSANHCYTTSRKGDSNPVHHSDPTRTHTYTPALFLNLLCTYPPTAGHSPSIGSSTSLPEPCHI